MKLVIALRNKGEWPHILQNSHLSQIKRTAPSAKVVVALGERAIEREARDADAIAGFPMGIPSITSGMPVRWIHSFSAGVDRILTPEVRGNKNIAVSNSSGIHKTPIAEHVLGFMLMETRKFVPSILDQQQKKWGKRDIIKAKAVTELADKTVLIIGMGAIGSEIARLSHAFGCHVLGVVRRKRKKPAYVERLYAGSTFKSALSKADFVIVCLPGGTATEGLLGKAEFSSMKRASTLINIGRGSTIDQKELIKALKRGAIGGAMLDVTSPEPLPVSSPLWKMKNVVITPHYSGLSEKYMDRAIEQLCANLKAFRARKPLPNRVDKELGY